MNRARPLASAVSLNDSPSTSKEISVTPAPAIPTPMPLTLRGLSASITLNKSSALRLEVTAMAPSMFSGGVFVDSTRTRGSGE